MVFSWLVRFGGIMANYRGSTAAIEVQGCGTAHS